jgi:hypothetical protein
MVKNIKGTYSRVETRYRLVVPQSEKALTKAQRQEIHPEGATEAVGKERVVMSIFSPYKLGEKIDTRSRWSCLPPRF